MLTADMLPSLVLQLVDFEMAPSLGCSEDYFEAAGERLCGLLTGQTRKATAVSPVLFATLPVKSSLRSCWEMNRIGIQNGLSPSIL